MGLILVCFCVFLWMFFLGLWAGQTVLQPSGTGKSPYAQFTSPFRAGKPRVVEAPAAENETVLGEEASATVVAEPEETAASFFSLQISAFRDIGRAGKDVEQWRSKGFDAFSVPPEDAGDPFTRVYIGRFDKLSEANQLSARLEKEEKVKAYIALLPAARVQSP